MSRTAWLDAFAGIAGDMTVAALVHAGAPADAVLTEVATLGVPGWTARTERVVRGAYAATRFVVDVAPGQPWRTWRTIRSLLRSSALHPRVRARAEAVFVALAEAEARVHGTPVDDVHFHEVGAVDSVVDVVGACAALEFLDVDTVVATPLPMGSGQVSTAHGVLPVPVPAVVEVLRGWPVVPFPHPGEVVTPTGAAIVAALATPGPMPAMRVASVGYGAGTRDPSTHANVLRVVLGEGSAGSVGEVVELRAQLDDLAGEAVPPLLDALFAAGALDAFVTPVLMKKGRPGLLVTALAAPDAAPLVGAALLRHGGTFGYRHQRLAREVAARRWEEVLTPYGAVRLKIAERAGEVLHVAPEFEDCAAAARAHGVSVAEVMRAALARSS